jgi:TatD DNase family protein
MIDTHSHLYSEEFKADIEDVIQRSNAAGVSRVYLPAIDNHSHGMMMELVEKHPEYCIPMMGLHPCYVDGRYEAELNIVSDWLERRPFAAIGEIGLDFYHSVEFKTQQEIAFQIQIEWAIEKELPMVIHSRSSMDECIKMIAQHGRGKARGIFHCFGGDERQAKNVIELGFYLGIGGVVTYKNAGLAKIVEETPLEYLVLETDAPYLSPVPYRGKRNESSYIVHVAQKIAELKGISIEEVDEITTTNAKKIFAF